MPPLAYGYHRVLDDLVGALDHPNLFVQFEAARRLGSIGGYDPTIAPQTIEALKRRYYFKRVSTDYVADEEYRRQLMLDIIEGTIRNLEKAQKDYAKGLEKKTALEKKNL